MCSGGGDGCGRDDYADDNDLAKRYYSGDTLRKKENNPGLRRFSMAALMVCHLGGCEVIRSSARSLITCSSAWKYALSDRFPLLQKPHMSRLWKATSVRRCFLP